MNNTHERDLKKGKKKNQNLCWAMSRPNKTLGKEKKRRNVGVGVREVDQRKQKRHQNKYRKEKSIPCFVAFFLR